MATLSISFAGHARSKTIPNDHATRLVAALKTFYGPVADGAGSLRDMTDTEALDRWYQGIVQSAKDITRSVEGDAARQSAVSGVRDIDVT